MLSPARADVGDDGDGDGEPDSEAVEATEVEASLFELDELDDEEYEIPPVNADSASISLEDVLLFNADWNENVDTSSLHDYNRTNTPTPSTNSAKISDNNFNGFLLKHAFLQGVSQQISNLEQIDAGLGCSIAAKGDLIAIGTSHGVILAFSSQILRWCCKQNKDQAAVTTLDYNESGLRLLAGFARGVIIMYDSIEGEILRRIEICNGGPWGVLHVSWISISSENSSAIVADTGGSVWFLRFTRTFGIRGTKVSCLFSGARGEVCAVEPLNEYFNKWGGILALATLSRVVVVWGVGGVGSARPRAACQALLVGPFDSLPLLAWQPYIYDPTEISKSSRCRSILCSVRGYNVQFHQIRWDSSGPKMLSLKSPKPLTHKATAVRWLTVGRLAILDEREILYLLETTSNNIVDMLDLSYVQLVYANAHFKGVATGGKVSEALALAGAGALGGSVTSEITSGALLLVGKIGVVRITARTRLAAAYLHAEMGRWVQAFETIVDRYKSLDSEQLQNCLRQRASLLFNRLTKNPIHLVDNSTALATIDACTQLKMLDTLWGPIWDAAVSAKCETAIIVNACKRASESLLPWISPAACQYLVDVMRVKDPETLQKALLYIPIKCMDLHQVLSECRLLKLWSAWVRVTAATAPDDPALPLRELLPLVGKTCREPDHSSCPGNVLLLYTSDCFSGRIYPTGLVAISDRPHIGQEVLRCLLYDPVDGNECDSIRLPHLRSFLLHDTASTLHMLEMSFNIGPFIGPLGKQKRLSMGIALHNVLQTSYEGEFKEIEIAEIIHFTCNRLLNGSLPPDITLINHVKKYFSKIFTDQKANNLIEISWLNLMSSSNNITNHLPQNEMLEIAKNTKRLKVKRYVKECMGEFDEILDTFLEDPEDSEKDLFLYLEKYVLKEERMIAKQIVTCGRKIALNWPQHTAQFLLNYFPELIFTILSSLGNEPSALAFSEFLHKHEALNNELAVKYLELLCILQPKSVLSFLCDAPSTLIPDTALKLVQKYNVHYAEPKCLEMTGDLINAVKKAIQLLVNSETREDRDKLAEEAYTLCIRATKLSGPGEAESFWKELIESISELSEPLSSPLPALLLEGAAYYLPLPWLVAKLCSHGGNSSDLKGALINLLESTKDNAEAMAATSRLTGNELHLTLATALRGRRILSVPSVFCGYCHNPLISQSFTRAYACGHAFHVDCDPVSGCCGYCGKKVKKVCERHIPINILFYNEPIQSFPLQIVAPPRPDLEGII